MVMFKHPAEKGQVTVTSNGGVFSGKKPEAVAREAFADAMPQRPVMRGGKPVMDPETEAVKLEPDVTGREPIYVGKTMYDSQVAAESHGKKL